MKVLKQLIDIVEKMDPYTKGHSYKVYTLAKKIAAKLKLCKKEISTIGKAALFHDVGKIIIDRKILNKKGTLTI